MPKKSLSNKDENEKEKEEKEEEEEEEASGDTTLLGNLLVEDTSDPTQKVTAPTFLSPVHYI